MVCWRAKRAENIRLLGSGQWPDRAPFLRRRSLQGPHLTAAKSTKSDGTASRPDGGLLAVGSVAHLDAEGRELVAEGVGRGEVAGRSRRGAPLEQLRGATG